MSQSAFYRWVNKLMSRRCSTKKPRQLRRILRFEQLDQRLTPSVNASSMGGVLTVIGDNLNNQIEVSRDVAGNLLVNGGAVKITGRAPTVNSISAIQIFGLGGDDRLSLNDTNGALPRASIHGGNGNDTLIGAAAADYLYGDAGNDTLLGNGGNDFLFGGDGNDTLTGGAGNDQVFGEIGDDQMIWNPGDGTDVNEGGAGNDTVIVNGGNAAETFTTTANGSRVRFDRTDPAPFSIDIGTSEHLILNANGGDDHFSASGNLAPLIQISVDGGAGNDTIIGSNGADRLSGGDGNDFIDGKQGNDSVFLGAGDDTFQWDPGDGSDTVEGQDGNDTMIFNGASANENFSLSANGNRLRLVRDVGTVTMDTAGIENVDLNALGGADNITLNDLSGTGVTNVNVDLGATSSGAVGDAQSDTVTVNATNNADRVQISGTGSSFAVAGLSTVINVTNSEGTLDNFVVNTLGGNDTVDASALAAGVTLLTINGGSGDDVITGSRGADTLIGGDGNDLVIGGPGNDVAFLGAGNDTFVWNPGDASDTVEGQDGLDTMQFNGNNLNENISLSANGNRLNLVRDLGKVTMDVAGTEQVNVAALGGADTITVNDLSGTGVTGVAIDLASPAGSGTGDGQTDNVIINGTTGNDSIKVAGDATGVSVSGLATRVAIVGAESTDKLMINALADNDIVDGSGLAAGAISLTADGGDDDDILIGGQGDDTLIGGNGDDILKGGPGTDTLDGGAGDNIVKQDF